MTPVGAHSLSPEHPTQQPQLTLGRGGEAEVEAGMCAGGEGGGPQRGGGSGGGAGGDRDRKKIEGDSNWNRD